MQNSLSRQILLSIFGLAILIVAVVGVSYAVFVTTLTGSKENEITTGTISMSFVDKNDGISIMNAMPMSDSAGMKLSAKNEVYDFVVNSTISGVTTVNYEVVAEKIFSDKIQLDDNSIKLYLQRYDGGKFVDTPITSAPLNFKPAGVVSKIGSPENGMILYEGSFSNASTTKKDYSETFRLKMWVDDDAIVDSISRNFKIRISVYGKVL